MSIRLGSSRSLSISLALLHGRILYACAEVAQLYAVCPDRYQTATHALLGTPHVRRLGRRHSLSRYDAPARWIC